MNRSTSGLLSNGWQALESTFLRTGQLPDFLGSNTIATVAVSFILFASLTLFLSSNNLKGGVGYPYAGGVGWWEPSFFLRLRFVLGAGRIIRAGYEKVSS
jgi:hypothetical protein